MSNHTILLNITWVVFNTIFLNIQWIFQYYSILHLILINTHFNILLGEYWFHMSDSAWYYPILPECLADVRRVPVTVPVCWKLPGIGFLGPEFVWIYGKTRASQILPLVCNRLVLVAAQRRLACFSMPGIYRNRRSRWVTVRDHWQAWALGTWTLIMKHRDWHESPSARAGVWGMWTTETVDLSGPDSDRRRPGGPVRSSRFRSYRKIFWYFN